jgi:hypothetical protein
MANLKDWNKPLSPESQRLHDLIQKKNKEELAGVAYMRAHPLSMEQIEAQIKANSVYDPDEFPQRTTL